MTIGDVSTDPDAVRVLCFGDSNTYGTPGDDPDYVRLPADRRWTGRLQRLLGEGYDVVEEGLNGRTTDLDYVDRPGCNGRTYWAPTSALDLGRAPPHPGLTHPVGGARRVYHRRRPATPLGMRRRTCQVESG